MALQILKNLIITNGSSSTTGNTPRFGIASNSPKQHVQKVLHALGLAHLPGLMDVVLTPDSDRPVSLGIPTATKSITDATTTTTRHDSCNDSNNTTTDNVVVQDPMSHNDDATGSTTTTTTMTATTNTNMVYPTKVQPLAFFQPVLSQYQAQDICLIDDSSVVCSVVQSQTDMQVVQVIVGDEVDNEEEEKEEESSTTTTTTTLQTQKCHQRRSLMEAILLAMGWLDPDFVLNDVLYLQSKNQIDQDSLHGPTWECFLDQIAQMIRAKTRAEPLVIVDLGAGLLSLLRMLLQGREKSLQSNNNNSVGPSTDNLSHSSSSPSCPSLKTLFQTDAKVQAKLDRIVYYAYESNQQLLAECQQTLNSLGFVSDVDKNDMDTANKEEELVYYRQEDDTLPYMEVRLRLWDFRHPPTRGGGGSSSSVGRKAKLVAPPNVILGCCFADLWEPRELVQCLRQQFLCHSSSSSWHGGGGGSGGGGGEALVYFPITFSGITQFLPPQPLVPTSSTATTTERNSGTIPSDTMALALYTQALCQQYGHHVNVDRLIEEMKQVGGQLVSKGSSDWVIPATTTTTTKSVNTTEKDDHEDSYMWQSMLYFFGMTAAPSIHKANFDAHAWLQRTRQTKPTIHVSNQDLLFRLPFLGMVPSWTTAKSSFQPSMSHTETIQFTSPHQVTTTIREIPKETLAENKVRIASVCSLISSGTELKIFKGLFDDDGDAALDVNIQGMQQERMAYPLSYGYSLVGRVVECGSGVTDRDSLVGKLVFAFAPHSTQVIVDREAMQLVPEGIDPYDAIFLPSVETALSIVHDAHVRLGEKVAVFGQGLIGLLVTALLSRQSGGAGGFLRPPTTMADSLLTATDTIPNRMAASAALGASQVLLPSNVKDAGPFDVAIEASGNPRALQAAIDHTNNNGRVVIASWYGDGSNASPVQLKLGIDFHRSHKTIITSQVSQIPPQLTGTWTKQRRFSLAWELVRQLQPSRILLTRTASLSDAQEVYQALERGQEIAVAFDYQNQ